MARSCLDGYLTEGCKTCPDWHDGSDGSIGCGTHFPIMLCPYFARMYTDSIVPTVDADYEEYTPQSGTKMEENA